MVLLYWISTLSLRLLIGGKRMLSPRTDMILKTIVSRYIEQAVPVPSQSLVKDRELDVCSATIRNEMVRLEKDGYITRRYSSAGGIPTDKGYRYYVESLGEVALPADEQRLIGHMFHQVEQRLEEWLALAATLIARLVQNVAIVTEPKTADSKFRHIELVPLQDSLALVVLILHGARVKQQLISFNRSISPAELVIVASKLSALYAGLTSSQISSRKVELSEVEQAVTDCVVEMMRFQDAQDYSEPYFDGLHYTLNQPEFVNSRRAAELVELVEHRHLLRAVLPPELAGEGVKVVIGRENRAEVAHECSLVVGKYGLPSGVVGTIGVIGPTRMPYSRAISAVRYLSVVLSVLVAELYRDENVE